MDSSVAFVASLNPAVAGRAVGLQAKITACTIADAKLRRSAARFSSAATSSLSFDRDAQKFSARRSFLQGRKLTAAFKNVTTKMNTSARASGVESTESFVEKMLETMSSRSVKDLQTLKEFAVDNRRKLTLPAFVAASAAFSQLFPESASAATTISNLIADPSALTGMMSSMSSLPLAAVEVGKHWYWDVAGVKVHGQTLITSWIMMTTAVLALAGATRKPERVPGEWQNFGEFVYEFVEDIARTNIPEPEYKEWIPFVGMLFLFIFASNWGGALIPWKLIHLPGGEGELAAPTNDINVTVAMALMTSFAYFYAGIKGAGLAYFSKYLKPTPLLLPLNVIEDFTKPLSLSFRLFGNILADELVVAVLVLLVPLVVPLPAMILGLFTSAIQALIFATLASTYIGEAVEVGHELHHEEH